MKIQVHGILILISLLLSAYCSAEELTGFASVHFSGTSTLHDFEGQVSAEPFTIHWKEDGETSIVSATATVQVAEMDTDNKKRDRKMLRMFDQENFPLVRVILPPTPILKEAETETTLLVTIRSVEEPVYATISEWRQNSEEISCTLQFNISLETFGLEAPSVMGLINVADTVHVECNINSKLLKSEFPKNL
ncbi:MAG: YceI family protein [Opitutales bacterium]|nr:YceI family protein [Opitutales bacterium]